MKVKRREIPEKVGRQGYRAVVISGEGISTYQHPWLVQVPGRRATRGSRGRKVLCSPW